MGRFDSCATNPNRTLDDDGGYHGEDSGWRESCDVVFAAREKLFDGLLKNLQKRDDHNDREHQNSKWFKTSATHWELLLELIQAPAYESVGGPDNYSAKKIECRVNQRRDKGERARPNSRYTFRSQQEDVDRNVDLQNVSPVLKIVKYHTYIDSPSYMFG